MSEDAGLDCDIEGFKTCMEAQKQRARDARAEAFGGNQIVLETHEQGIMAKEPWNVEATDDSDKYNVPVDGTSRSFKGLTVKAVYDGKEFLKQAAPGAAEGAAAAAAAGAAGASNLVGIVLDKTPFYAESGGQLCDTGVLSDDDGQPLFNVLSVKAYGRYVLHVGVPTATIKVGDVVKAIVDAERRALITPNHSMTHILNLALREVVGKGTDQRGSINTVSYFSLPLSLSLFLCFDLSLSLSLSLSLCPLFHPHPHPHPRTRASTNIQPANQSINQPTTQPIKTNPRICSPTSSVSTSTPRRSTSSS